MYSYEESSLSKQEILDTIPQELILEKLVTGYPIVCYEKVYSPIREDKHPGCFFEWVGGKLMFKDFAFLRKPLDCFDMVSRKYGHLPFDKTLKLISDSFRGQQFPVVIPTEKEKAQSHPITFRTRLWEPRDIEYWGKYDITTAQLMEDRVFALVWYKFFSRKLKTFIVVRPVDICYAYTEFGVHTKVYRPTNRDHRFLTNCTQDDIGNITNIEEYGEVLVITKSYKDCRVLRNLGVHSVIWFQNEGMIPHTDLLTPLMGFKTWKILFDGDEAGIKAALRVHQDLSAIHPTEILTLPGKDPAQLYKTDKALLMEFLQSI
jgi:hypothetical protein